MPRITLTVNGRAWEGDVHEDETLLAVLRERLELTGAKSGCGEGACGSCTVLVDRRPVLACSVRAVAVSGLSLTTVEGLATGGRLHPVQQAFLDAQAFQCGFCTPGMIIAAVALLERTPTPADEEVTRALDGHLCRCGAYPQILDAVRKAGQAMQKVPHRG
jgi:aerobic-type carbon monoxide dehydrogenase small subunit (CoxS/CutS family)